MPTSRGKRTCSAKTFPQPTGRRTLRLTAATTPPPPDIRAKISRKQPVAGRFLYGFVVAGGLGYAAWSLASDLSGTHFESSVPFLLPADWGCR